MSAKNKSILEKPVDIFGNAIEDKSPLKEKYGISPFSVLDTKTGEWKRRKNLWLDIGMQSEIGRDVKIVHPTFRDRDGVLRKEKQMKDASIFDPVLCEIMYNWFCPEGGTILDCFAGGSVRGIVSNYLGFNYTGVDIRPEQIESNYEQGIRILGKDRCPNWITGDSNVEIPKIEGVFDLLLSCPPYADLEVYSDLEGDISNKNYKDFLLLYRSIIEKSCRKVKSGGFAVFVVGEVRNKKTGEYYGFVPDTIKAFTDCGMQYYNEAILLNAIGTAMMRVGNTFERGNGKLVKVHQNVLIFKKPEDFKDIPEDLDDWFKM